MKSKRRSGWQFPFRARRSPADGSSSCHADVEVTRPGSGVSRARRGPRQHSIPARLYGSGHNKEPLEKATFITDSPSKTLGARLTVTAYSERLRAVFEVSIGGPGRAAEVGFGASCACLCCRHDSHGGCGAASRGPAGRVGRGPEAPEARGARNRDEARGPLINCRGANF